ncbi:Protein of uncharacterised function (DUF1353) [Raoultella terrigena]|uniref:Protein of uncharacterized function (DUF1353) n=1 Tax=Raoultella terrigena TaxID=577 RepID=A0A3P8J2C7_RAOTE|nr:Protein of uncharacterised function (DUF1353) [Raoultella terrigena]
MLRKKREINLIVNKIILMLVCFLFQSFFYNSYANQSIDLKTNEVKRSSFLLAEKNVPFKAIGPAISISLNDGVYEYLYSDMIYEIGNTGEKIIVPAGFVTDFASIPPELSRLGLKSKGEYGRAAVVHDYLYWTQVCTKDQADRILVLGMKESDVNAVKRFFVHAGVHDFGKPAWQENYKEKNAGLIRFIPKEYFTVIYEKYPNFTWKELQKKLILDGVKDPVIAKNPTYCHYGDSFVVPKK